MADRKSGFGGKAYVNGTDIAVKEWRHTGTVTYADTTHSDAGAVPGNDDVAAEEQIPVSGAAEAEFNATWDADAEPTDDPPHLVEGVQLTDLRLYLGSTSKYIGYPLADVLSVEVANAVKGEITWRVSVKANGAWTLPT